MRLTTLSLLQFSDKAKKYFPVLFIHIQNKKELTISTLCFQCKTNIIKLTIGVKLHELIQFLLN